MNLRSALKLIAACALFSTAAGLLSACSGEKPKFTAIDITGADYAKDFALTDSNGKARSLQDFKGKIVVLFFGYTQCPDVCPTSLAELADVKKRLGADGDKLQGVFVSVDPARDSPQVLKSYMENFDPSFLALYGSPDELLKLAKDYKVYFKKVDGKSPTSYTVDHSAGSYIYDTQGKVRLYTRYGSGADALEADIKLLLQQTP